MAQFLILYARQDNEFAKSLMEALRIQAPSIQFGGLDDLFDVMGGSASSHVQDILLQSDGLIALLSPDALKSPHVKTTLQWYAALHNKLLITAIIRPVSIPAFISWSLAIVAEGLSPAELATKIVNNSLGDLRLFSSFQTLDHYRRDPVTGWQKDGQILVPRDSGQGLTVAQMGADDIEEDEQGEVDEERSRSAPSPPQPELASPPAPLPSRVLPPVISMPSGVPVYQMGAEDLETRLAEHPEMEEERSWAEAEHEERKFDEEVRRYQDEKYRQIERERSRPVETLQFTAYHAGATPVQAPQTLLVYSHIAEQARKVRSDAGTFTELGSMPQVTKGVSLRKVPRNIEITIEPHFEGVSFSPPRDRFIWEGEWRRSLFRYAGARKLAGTTRTGWIDIYAGRVSPICTITISLSFLGNVPVASLSDPHGINVTSNVFDTVFISYSHRDREPMRQARETYESLGVTAYHDELLEAGDNFEQRLAEMIRAASVFHLLWSDSAAQSPNVRKEWLLALETRNDERFIRPWYWRQPLAPPPEELRARKISFRYEHLRRRLFRPSTWR